MLFVSRTPDAVIRVAICLRELPDNPVLIRRRLARFGRAQSNRLTDFELVRCHALERRFVGLRWLNRAHHSGLGFFVHHSKFGHQ
jgi:hypothetical protein